MNEAGSGAARRWRQIASRALPPVLFALAAFVLWRELRALSPAMVAERIQAWGPWRIVAALALSTAVYGLLAINETLALRWLGAKVRWRDSLTVSFIAYAFANTIGLNLLVAAAVRVRGYSHYGVDLVTVAAASLYCSVAFWLGLSALAGASLIQTTPGAAIVLLAAPAAYLAVCAAWRGPITVRGRTWRAPPLRYAASQVLLGVLVNLTLASVIYVLLAGEGLGYVAFARAYAGAIALGLVSGVPGGLGVFESALVTLSPGLDHAALAAGLIGYRLFYFLIPLVIAFLVMAFRERALARSVLARFRRRG